MEKREQVLNAIKPICEAFKIDDYDYVIDYEKGIERLRIYDTEIGRSCNSVSAIIDELVGYIFVNRWTRNRHLGAFQTQVLNVIKRYWIKK